MEPNSCLSDFSEFIESSTPFRKAPLLETDVSSLLVCKPYLTIYANFLFRKIFSVGPMDP